MESTTLLGVATTAWGVVMSVAPILQIRRIRSAGTSAGVSRGHLVVLLIGFGLWLAYGIAIDLLPLVITNAVSLVATAAWLVEVRRYRPRADAPRVASAGVRRPSGLGTRIRRWPMPCLSSSRMPVGTAAVDERVVGHDAFDPDAVGSEEAERAARNAAAAAASSESWNSE